jgi:hypothetical protein
MDTFGWQFFVFIGGMTLVVLLVMGPGNWSSSNEFPPMTLWRWLRRKLKARDEPPPKP